MKLCEGPERTIFLFLIWGRGGVGFPLILSKTVDTTNILIMNKDQILNGFIMTDAFHSQFKHVKNGWLLKRDK